MKIKRTFGEVVFDVFNVILIFLVMLACIYPLWYVVVASLSTVDSVASGQVTVWPVGFNLASYDKIIHTKNIWTSYGNTFYYAIFGTTFSMILTTLGAYAFSKRYLYGRKLLTWLFIISMWFGAGMMPAYLNYKNLGLLNNRFGILCCGGISTFNVILLRTYFESIPAEMEESAKLDGANDFRILFDIYLPLSLLALMTITLYYLVGRWNSYFWTMLLVTDEKKISLQVLLKKLVVEMGTNNSEAGSIDYQASSRETMMYATMVAAILPMVVLYPFIQKYFVKGIMVGAVKG